SLNLAALALVLASGDRVACTRVGKSEPSNSPWRAGRPCTRAGGPATWTRLGGPARVRTRAGHPEPPIKGRPNEPPPKAEGRPTDTPQHTRAAGHQHRPP